MTRKMEERALLLQLQDTHGYRVLEMERASERTIGTFTRRGSRMTYTTNSVVRLVVPAGSWLGDEMRKKRTRKMPTKQSRKKQRTTKHRTAHKGDEIRKKRARKMPTKQSRKKQRTTKHRTAHKGGGLP